MSKSLSMSLRDAPWCYWLNQYQFWRVSSWFLGSCVAMGLEKPLHNHLERVVSWNLLGVKVIFLSEIMSNLCHRFSFGTLNYIPVLLLLLKWAVTDWLIIIWNKKHSQNIKMALISVHCLCSIAAHVLVIQSSSIKCPIHRNNLTAIRPLKTNNKPV